MGPHTCTGTNPLVVEISMPSWRNGSSKAETGRVLSEPSPRSVIGLCHKEATGVNIRMPSAASPQFNSFVLGCKPPEIVTSSPETMTVAPKFSAMCKAASLSLLEEYPCKYDVPCANALMAMALCITLFDAGGTMVPCTFDGVIVLFSIFALFRVVGEEPCGIL